MAKNGQQPNGTFATLGFNPDIYAGALAHVIKVETGDQGRRETVLGQAWLAGIGKLVTAGHVVESHVAAMNDGLRNDGSLIVTFPYSGNRYPIKEIRMHPSFVRQPDGLVKFDAALLLVEFHEPELSARVLPIVYEKVLPVQLGLTAVRYPVHLGQYSSDLNPLAQSGRLLGPLRKHDDYHLLHDTALAPGDSGAPIFDGESLVALHCGDTASLPGLNLPTTSIRLALWVDALRELGIEGTTASAQNNGSSARPALLITAFWVVFLLTMGAVSAYRALPALTQKAVENSKNKPISVKFDVPLDKYKYYQPASFTMEAQSDSYVYVYAEDGPNKFQRIFPTYASDPRYPEKDQALPALYTLSKGKTRVVDMVGNSQIRVDCSPIKFHLVSIALKSDSKPLTIGPSYEKSEINGAQLVTLTDRTAEVSEARKLQAAHPDLVHEYVFDGPVASKESKLEYEKANPAK